MLLDLDILGEVEARLEAAPHCLYARNAALASAGAALDPARVTDPREREARAPAWDADVRPDRFDGFLGGSFVITIHDPATGAPRLDLFVLNSRRWFHVPPETLAWMQAWTRARAEREDLAPPVPALCFYHVPNVEFDHLWRERKARGFLREPVCFERDDGRVHAAFRALGSVVACFVGHDHVNDYWGTWEGIRYEYGRKTGPGGYGSRSTRPPPGEKAVRTGAKLITLDLADPAGTLETRSMFADGSWWQPDG